MHLSSSTFPGLKSLGKALVKEGDQAAGVGTDQLVGLLAVLEDHEGGHGADAELLANLGQLIDVDLGEEDALVLLVVGVPARAVLLVIFSDSFFFFEARQVWPRGQT